MHPTEHSDINDLLSELLREIQAILGERLVGLYLYGSLVTGDFERGVSDFDLLAVTASYLDAGELARLDRMHLDFVARNPEWEDHVEIAYLSVDALKTFKTHKSKIAVISPGEPFHTKEAGRDWLINWYLVREKGVTLWGPPPEVVIGPISKEEFLQAVVDHARDWRDWAEQIESRPYQAYAVLTMCRALYAHRNGEQASKKRAALWAAQELPDWSHLIRNALLWRQEWRDKEIDPTATRPDTVRFVHFVVDLVTASSDPARSRRCK
jgi:predicted nucleotidyltransferase